MENTKLDRSSIGTKYDITTDKLLVKYRQYAILFKAFLHKYLRYISSPSRQEAILKTFHYSLWLLSRVYSQIPAKDKQSRANTVQAIATLAGELSWTRYLLRFFGLPAALEGIESGSWGSSSKTLGKAMAWTMVFYYPLEHIAYLHWKAPTMQWIPSNTTVATMWNPFGRRSQPPTSTSAVGNATCTVTGRANNNSPAMSSSQIAAKASAWSCRFWLAYLILDIARAALELKKLSTRGNPNDNKKSKQNGNSQDTGHNENDDVSPTFVDPNLSLVRTERLQIVRSLLYVLPCIHWSLPNWDTKPWLSNDIVNGLCWVEAVVGMYQSIRNFQESC
ncbi:peroxisomal biogenesis factor 11 PEX11 [Nitzschia inconspicua]|uniref:Peroxisomal biogenesis factor 11 PEX11 n=1 Tax=Nitzschia inconspicua TaxID=303405 RepID=A0A9K3LG71_9STRA|nr:peroxisomal biogenesis factor 11 PEX11 [Nitzschia inconspicua]